MRRGPSFTMVAVAWLAFALAHAQAPPVPPQLIPGVEPIAPAEIKPEDFIYVAGTQPDRVGRVMVPVFVNGVGPFAFMVDTGASSSVLAPRVAKRLGLKPEPTRVKMLRGITGSELVPTVGVNSITAGEISLNEIELPLVEPRVFADADGIFGTDAFARGCLKVDFAAARITILRTSCPRADTDWLSTRVQLRFGGLAVARAYIGRVRVAAIIDTGAQHSLGNPALLAALGLEKHAEDPATRIQVYAATSQPVFGNIIATDGIRISGIEIGNLHPVFGDFEVFHLWGVENEPALVVGMDVLGTTRAMMLDFRREQLYLLPSDGDKLRLRQYGTPSRIP